MEKNIFGSLLEKLKPVSAQSRWLAYIAALGVLLVALSSMLPAKEEAAGKKAQADVSGSLLDYSRQTEQRLEELLSHIEGVGEAHVMVTLENGVEYRYAADEKQSGDSVLTYSSGSESPSKVQEKEDRQQSYILVESGGGKKPLVLTELSPRVKGVAVVCEGAKNPVICQRITETVTTVLDITSLQVCVIKSA